MKNKYPFFVGLWQIHPLSMVELCYNNKFLFTKTMYWTLRAIYHTEAEKDRHRK